MLKSTPEKYFTVSLSFEKLPPLVYKIYSLSKIHSILNIFFFFFSLFIYNLTLLDSNDTPIIFIFYFYFITLVIQKKTWIQFKLLSYPPSSLSKHFRISEGNWHHPIEFSFFLLFFFLSTFFYFPFCTIPPTE